MANFHTAFRARFTPISRSTPVRAEDTLTIYTDGSGTSGKCTTTTPAGWGWTSTSNFIDYQDSFGPVVVDPQLPGYLGAGAGSNNAAELSAWMEAALFLLAQDSIPPTINFVYDSKWTAHMITGKWGPKRHKTMIATARALCRALSDKTTISWERVKGHTGNVGNTRADQPADKG